MKTCEKQKTKIEYRQEGNLYTIYIDGVFFACTDKEKYERWKLKEEKRNVLTNNIRP